MTALSLTSLELKTSNLMGKFSPNLAEITKAIIDLPNKGSHWSWETAQQQAFQEIKCTLSSSPTLALYDHGKETELYRS